MTRGAPAGGARARGANNVAVFHPGAQHSYETALAFQEAGRLAWFATSIFFVPDRWPYRAAAFAPAGLRSRLEYEFRRRHHPELDPALVRTFGVCEWVERIGMRLGLRRVEHYANQYGNALFARRVARLAKADGVDVLWGFDTGSLGAFVDARRAGIRCILEQTIGHPRAWNRILTEEVEKTGPQFDPYPRPYPEADLERVDAELTLADRIVCGSEFVRRTLIAEGVRDRVIHVVPSGATIPSFSAAQTRSTGRELRLLFAGHFGMRKGAWYLLDAMRRLKRNDRVTLTIVGKRTVPDRFLQGFDRISVVPHVSRAAMADIYRQFDLMVLPTLFEGSSIAVFEALGCGLPVITTPNAGSVVRDGIEGFIVPVRDSETLASRIELLDADRRRLAAMSAAARKRALEFPWAAYRRRLVALVDSWHSAQWAA